MAELKKVSQGDEEGKERGDHVAQYPFKECTKQN
jgi:hypothetical protein